MRKQLLLLLWIALCLASLRAQAQTPVISGTLSVSLTGDANNNGQANPSDQLSYSLVISNTGSGSATGVNLTMPAPTNTTLVTGSLKTSTLARPDAYTTLISGSLSGTSVLPNDFGLPTKTVLSFGPSATPASVVANGTNPATTDQSGTVVMNTDGTFSYTPSGSFVGYDRFGYTATTTTPPNDAATVTIGVGTPVTANANSYPITGNVSNTQTVGTGVLVNDTGDQKVVTAVNGNTANVGVGVTTAQSGTVTLQSDGSFVYEPPAGYTGTDSFTYTANNGLNLPSSAVVSLIIQDMIWFVNNGAATAGTGTLARPFNSLAAFQAVNNGSGNNPATGDNIFVYTGSGNYTGGLRLLNNQKVFGQGTSAGLVTATGITPAPGSASFPTTNGTDPVITNTSGNSISVASGNTLRGLSIGSSSATALVGSSFGTLTVSEVTINTGSPALVLNTGTISGGFEGMTSTGGTNNVSLTSVAGSLTILAGTLSGAFATAFNVNGGTVGITYSGGISQASNAALLSVSGSHTSGTLLFQNGTLSATNGPGLQFDNADGTYTFSGTTTLNGGDAGIDIIGGSGGTFTFPASTGITNPSGSVINIVSSAPTFTYSGTFTKTNTGTGINAQNNTGGSITINGTGTKTLSTLTANAINLTNNTGVPINFSGNNLTLTTTGGTGFLATGGGTVNVTGTGNIINSGTGTALNVANTTIGASGLTFQSVSSNGGSATGIILDNTGTTGGGFTITGTGTTAGTGGILSSKSGADGSVLTGCGIYLNNTEKISLTNMNFTGIFQNYGIRGDEVNNFTLKQSNMTGTFGTNAAFNENTILFGAQSSSSDGLTGTALFEGNNIAGGLEDNVAIYLNGNGVLNVTFKDGTNPATHPAIIGLNDTDFGNDGIIIETQGTSSVTSVIDGVVFVGASGDNFQSLIGASSTQNITFTNNTLHNAHPDVVSGGGGITLNGGGTAATNYNLTYNISGNSFRGAKGDVINLVHLGNNANISGIIVNNIIGVDDGSYNGTQALRGSDGAAGISVINDHNAIAGTLKHAVRIEGNQIRDINGFGGIYVRSNGNGGVGAAAITIVEATVKNNIVEEGGPFLLSGFYSIIGGSSSTNDFGKMGLDLSNNNFSAAGTDGGNAVYLDVLGRSSPARYYLPGYAGSQNGEFALPTPGTASLDISNFLTGAPKNNVLVNGNFPNPLVSASSKVDAANVNGVLGTAFTMPVPQ